jgi:hypothetical protein
MDGLSEEQKARLERLLELDRKTIDQLEQVAVSDARMKWFWASARQFLGWAGAAAAAAVAFRNDLAALFKGFGQ